MFSYDFPVIFHGFFHDFPWHWVSDIGWYRMVLGGTGLYWTVPGTSQSPPRVVVDAWLGLFVVLKKYRKDIGFCWFFLVFLTSVG